MKILHVIPGLGETGNGIAAAARLIAAGQRKDGHEVDLVGAAAFSATASGLPLADEVWVHSMWTPMVWRACWKVLRRRAAIGAPRLVRMTHANLDPIRVRYHGWKKRLVAPLERVLFAKTDRVVVTGTWEADWCRRWGLNNEFQICDLKAFFAFGTGGGGERRTDRPLHVLYLGRRHPLKGVRYLEQAVGEINASRRHSAADVSAAIELREVSDASGDELEKVWGWCDVLCLPTLSENFGLVVAEALERGRPVVTTDGAPAWADLPGESGRYLKGYRDGDAALRVKLLKAALADLV